jgi:putative RecB family exonuclease
MIATLEPLAASARPIEELRATASASRLNTWLSCRLKFYLHYVLGLRKPRTASLYVGHAVHGVLKLWNQARWRHDVLTTEQLKQRFNTLWWQDQRNSPVRWEDGEEAEEKQTAWSLLDLYFRESPIPPNERPQAVEVSVEADLSAHGLPRLIGILDLVRAGRRIVDFKTVGQTPTDEKALHAHQVQLTAYAVLYRANTGDIEGGRDLHHLVKTKTPKLVVTQHGPMTEAERTRLFKQLESYSEGVARQDFVPSPGLQCSFCSFLPECKAWH